MSIKKVKQDIDYFSSPPPVGTPADIPGLLFWLDATDINGTGTNPADGPIGAWVDKSSNGFVFNRIDAAQSPELESSGFRSRPTVRVDGTMDGFQADPSFSSPTGSYTVFFVGQQTENNPGGFNAYLFDLSGTNRFLIWLNDDNSPGFYFQDAFQGTTAILESGDTYATWIFDEARTPTAELRLNGVSSRTDTNFVNTDLSANARIGSRFAAENPNNFDGRMSEFFFYNRTLTAGEIQQVEAYIKNKWGF